MTNTRSTIKLHDVTALGVCTPKKYGMDVPSYPIVTDLKHIYREDIIDLYFFNTDAE